MNTSSRNSHRVRNILLTTAVMLYCAAPALAGWNVGTALPDLTAYKLEGTLPELSGKVVLVDFWASWCAPCKASFSWLEKLHAKYAKDGLVILAINQDKTAKAMESFLKDHPVSFPIVRDSGNKVVAAADVTSMPSSFLIDRTGKIRYVHKGFHGEKTFQQYESEIGTLLKETGVKP